MGTDFQSDRQATAVSETEARRPKGLTLIYFAKFDGSDWPLFLIKPD